MKIEKATIEFETGIVEYPEMKVIDLAHVLIMKAQPRLDTSVPDSQIAKFRDEAKRDYMSSTKLFKDYEAYQELYVRLKIGEHIRVEHAKHSTNEIVMAYEKKIADTKSGIQQRLNKLKEVIFYSENSDPEIIDAVNNLFTPIKD